MKKAIVLSCFYQDIATSRPKTVSDYLKTHYEVEVLTADFCHSTKSYNTDNVENVVKIHVPPYKTNMSLRRIFSHVVYAFKIRSYIKKNVPDLLYVCVPPNLAGFLAVKMGKKKGSKCVVDVIDIWPNYNMTGKGVRGAFERIWATFRHEAVKSADIVILECRLYRSFLGMERERVHVVPLAKKAPQLEIGERETDPGRNNLYVCYLGAFSDSYDFFSMTYILAHLSKWHLHLDIIGYGERKEEVLEELKKNEIRYTDHGVVYDEDKKRKILAKCHLGYNGFVGKAIVGLSYKSIDYLSYGVPLLNSVKGDTWEVVESDQIGFNFSDSKLETVIRDIDRLSYEEFSEMKKRARKTFENNFEWNVYCNKMNILLSEIGEIE